MHILITLCNQNNLYFNIYQYFLALVPGPGTRVAKGQPHGAAPTKGWMF